MSAPVAVGASMRAASGGRFPALDKLRAFSMLYIVFFHSLMPYGKGSGWAVQDPTGTPEGLIVTWAFRGFTLHLFFLIAGFFAHLVYHRLGALEFAKVRATRLLLPFVVGSILQKPVVDRMLGIDMPYQPLHLWFLEYLIVISLLVPAAAHALRGVGSGAIPRFADHVVRWCLTTPLGVVVLSAFTAALLMMQKLDLTLLLPVEIADPSMVGTPGGFAIQLSVLVQYGFFFLVGWLLHRQTAILGTLKRYAYALLASGILAKGLIGILFVDRLLNGREGPMRLEEITMYVQGGFFAWCGVLGLIGLFLRAFNEDRPIGRYLADSAYWCFLVHPFPLMLTQLFLTRVDLPAPVKMLLAFGSAVCVCLVSYQYLCRYTWIGATLNGPRTSPSTVAKPASVPVLGR